MVIRFLLTCCVAVTLSCHPKGYGFFSMPDSEAEFPGGSTELYKFIVKNMRYPEAAFRANVSPGPVKVSFTVNVDGSVDQIEISEEPGFGVAEELSKVIKSMPCWKPAIRDGRACKSKYSLPLNICLHLGSRSFESFKLKSLTTDDPKIVGLHGAITFQEKMN